MPWENGQLISRGPLTPAEVRFQNEQLFDRERRRREVRIAESTALDKADKEKREAREAELRAAAEQRVAELRSRIESDAIQRGVPAHLLRAVVDGALLALASERARAVAAEPDQLKAELLARMRRSSIGSPA